MARHTSSKEAQRRAHLKFEKDKTKQLNIRLNNNTDQDVISFLDALPNKRGFILSIIRDYIARTRTE